MRFQPRAWLDRLRSTYWFVPSLVTTAAVAVAQALVILDRAVPPDSRWLVWAYGGGADGARALLSAVAGSTMTVVSVTFSVMVVALTVSSEHFGPRLLNNFMRDTAAQLVLGTFTGTFAFCLVVLRTVQGSGDGYEPFVPHLAVTSALMLALLSIAALIYYVHHIATALRLSQIAAAVTSDLEGTVERLYPHVLDERPPSPATASPSIPPAATLITSSRSGYLHRIDEDLVLELAVSYETVIWLGCQPGTFVLEGTAVAAVSPAPADKALFMKRLSSAFRLGIDRTSEQDAAFPVQQLVEVALRALSPGVNEPFTAITCVDRLAQGLGRLARREIPSGVRTDREGIVRVVLRPRTFAELARDAFEPIARNTSGGNVVVARRLLEVLGQLMDLARRDEDRSAVAGLTEFVWAHGISADDWHDARLIALRDAVRRAAVGTPGRGGERQAIGG